MKIGSRRPARGASHRALGVVSLLGIVGCDLGTVDLGAVVSEREAGATATDVGARRDAPVASDATTGARAATSAASTGLSGLTVGLTLDRFSDFASSTSFTSAHDASLIDARDTGLVAIDAGEADAARTLDAAQSSSSGTTNDIRTTNSSGASNPPHSFTTSAPTTSAPTTGAPSTSAPSTSAPGTTTTSGQSSIATPTSAPASGSTGTSSTATSSVTQTSSARTSTGDTTSDYPPFIEGPPAGNPEGNCAIPADAALEDVSSPDRVVGTGSPGSCTGDAFIEAVAEGGIITFDCGPDPVVITLDRPAKVFNNANPEVTIDGGGLVTLSGGGTTRILYMNTCDQDQVWTTPQCDNQDHPRLTVQNLTFVDGNSENETEYDGGGAIYASGGCFKVINSRFFNNVCAETGPDVGGAAIRVFQQYNALPAYVVNSTFGGAPALGNVCSNGGGISSIGVSWTIVNSLFSYNQAVGYGGNPALEDTLGGGSGGAIYNDGNTMTLSLCGSLLEHNDVNMFGSSIFFVSNNHTGSLLIASTISRNNTGGGWDALYPGISLHEDTFVSIDEASIIE